LKWEESGTKGMKTLPIIVAALTFMATAARAQVALPKSQGPGESCPHGYRQSGAFCVPSQRGAQDVVPKPPNGKCPWGWISSGDYCLRSGSGR
jgi:hypothetical protein